MTDSHLPEKEPSDLSGEEVLSALFAQLVMQQSNMAMMLLGKVPHPETGQVARDIEAAKFFIDQLEMLEVKTKGNLSKEEAALLKQSLMSLHLAFVEAVDKPEPRSATSPADAAGPASQPSQTVEPGRTEPAADEESRKKFSKKY